MKIAVLLETNFSGGGSFTHSVNVCLDLKKTLKKEDTLIVYTQFKNNYEILKKLKIPVQLFSHSLLDKILLKLSLNKFFRCFSSFFNLLLSVEKEIFFKKFDLVFFPVLSNTSLCLKKINFISTLLDLEHFKHSQFPEITFEEYKYREKLYFYSLKKSLLVITSSESIKKNLCKHYQIRKDKVFVIPYTPSILFKREKLSKNFLKKYEKISNYLFYPAQIWGHKNHIVILKASKILRKKKIFPKFIFSGRDRGFKRYLQEYIKKNNLKNIYFTGFLTSGEMHYMYKKCKAVIFPTLWGPNAIPPLETWSYKKPLIYNNRFEDDVTLGTAIVGDVRSPKFIASSIEKVLRNQYNKNFIIKGYNKLQLVEKVSKKSYKNLYKKIALLK